MTHADPEPDPALPPEDTGRSAAGRGFAVMVAAAALVGAAWFAQTTLSLRWTRNLTERGTAVVGVVRGSDNQQTADDLIAKGAILWAGQKMVVYDFVAEGKVWTGTGPVPARTRLQQGEPIAVRHLGEDPAVSVPEAVALDNRTNASLAVTGLLGLMGLALLGALAGGSPHVARQGVAILLFVGFVLFLRTRLDARLQERTEKLRNQAGQAPWVTDERGVQTVRLISGADDTTAFNQSNSNEVAFPALAFGRHTGQQQDLAFLRFLILLPPGAKVTGARLELRCNSNRHEAGTRPDVMLIRRVDGTRSFSRKHYANYAALRKIKSHGAPIRWRCSPWKDGQTYRSPDIAPLIRDLLAAKGYAPGAYLGLSIGPEKLGAWGLLHLRYAGSAERSEGAVLRIEYELP